jgi:hypothetical protein
VRQEESRRKAATRKMDRTFRFTFSHEVADETSKHTMTAFTLWYACMVSEARVETSKHAHKNIINSKTRNNSNSNNNNNNSPRAAAACPCLVRKAPASKHTPSQTFLSYLASPLMSLHQPQLITLVCVGRLLVVGLLLGVSLLLVFCLYGESLCG